MVARNTDQYLPIARFSLVVSWPNPHQAAMRAVALVRGESLHYHGGMLVGCRVVITDGLARDSGTFGGWLCIVLRCCANRGTGDPGCVRYIKQEVTVYFVNYEPAVGSRISPDVQLKKSIVNELSPVSSTYRLFLAFSSSCQSNR